MLVAALEENEGGLVEEEERMYASRDALIEACRALSAQATEQEVEEQSKVGSASEHRLASELKTDRFKHKRHLAGPRDKYHGELHCIAGENRRLNSSE